METTKTKYISGEIDLVEALKILSELEIRRQQQLIRADELIAAELDKRRQGRDDSKALPKAG